MIRSQGVKRFLQYSLIGLGTFLFDLLLLFILTEVFFLNYLHSAAVAFLIAVSINYVLSRCLVFKGTTRGPLSGYANFFIIAGLGLLFVTVSMYVLVELYGVYYVLARVVVAAVTGVWNYLMNLFFNFKVAGVHDIDTV